MPEFPERLAVCEFKPDDPQTGLEHTRGVYITEDNTGLRMKYGGLYYIYISIQFRPQSRFPCSRFKYKVSTPRLFEREGGRKVERREIEWRKTVAAGGGGGGGGGGENGREEEK